MDRIPHLLLAAALALGCSDDKCENTGTCAWEPPPGCALVAVGGPVIDTGAEQRELGATAVEGDGWHLPDGTPLTYSCDASEIARLSMPAPTDAGSDASAGDSGGAGGAGPVEDSGMGGATDSGPMCPVCEGQEPHCGPEFTCVECLDSTHCATESAPRCDTTLNECRGCLNATDCASFLATPECESFFGQCVECDENTHCTDPTASACGASNACEACDNNADCSHLSDLGVCDDGTCVECTIVEESECGGKSCDPATKECTGTDVGSLDSCESCVADSECIGGNQADPDARCVPLDFDGTAQGGSCLTRVSSTCPTNIFQIPVNAPSLSGATAENYCGIDEANVSCAAVAALIDEATCAGGMDSECPAGGLCRTVGVNDNRCTYSCGTPSHCPAGLTCTGGMQYCH